jgi:hypothetical protein
VRPGEKAGHVHREMHTCKHFPQGGVMRDQCKAGVVLRSVRSVTPGTMATWPCLDENAPIKCPKIELPTREEATATVEQWNAAITRVLTDLKESRCPECHVQPDRYEQRGACVYALPCGHRIGQGKAADMEKRLRAAREGEGKRE